MTAKLVHDDGPVQLWHGDAREVVSRMPGASVDLIWTDPPYGHNNNDGDLAHKREAALGLVQRGMAEPGEARPIAGDSPDEAQALVCWLFAEAKRLLRPGCCCCCCCCGGGPDPQFARWSLWLDELLGFKHAVVWDKGGLGMGWHYRRNYEMVLIGMKPGGPCKWNGGNETSNVLRLSGIKPQDDEHPTLKPEALAGHFIRLHSDPGDVVLDPFAGSGTALVAAKRLGRRAIGVEIDERWVEIALRRLRQEALGLWERGPRPEQEPAALGHNQPVLALEPPIGGQDT